VRERQARRPGCVLTGERPVRRAAGELLITSYDCEGLAH
jgi:hypothetical protein